MTKILITDDNDPTRGILAEILQSHANWEVCAQVGNGPDAVSKATELRPDVVILDLAMPFVDGITAAREIAKVQPSVLTYIYTLHDGRAIELEAKKAGVRRVLAKVESAEGLVLAIEQELEAEEKEVSSATTDVTAPIPLGEMNLPRVQPWPAEPTAAPATDANFSAGLELNRVRSTKRTDGDLVVTN